MRMLLDCFGDLLSSQYRIMEPKLSDVPLQPLMKSSEAEDEKAVAHDQAELREASNKGQHWLKRCLSQKGKSIFIAVTTMLGYILLYLAISAIAPFYPIWVSLSTNCKLN